MKCSASLMNSSAVSQIPTLVWLERDRLHGSETEYDTCTGGWQGFVRASKPMSNTKIESLKVLRTRLEFLESRLNSHSDPVVQKLIADRKRKFRNRKLSCTGCETEIWDTCLEFAAVRRPHRSVFRCDSTAPQTIRQSV